MCTYLHYDLVCLQDKPVGKGQFLLPETGAVIRRGMAAPTQTGCAAAVLAAAAAAAGSVAAAPAPELGFKKKRFHYSEEKSLYKPYESIPVRRYSMAQRLKNPHLKIWERFQKADLKMNLILLNLLNK